MNPRLAGCSFVHRGRSLEEGLRDATAFGFRAVDVGVGGLHGHLSPVDVAADPLPYAERVRAAAEALGLSLNESFTLNFGPPINAPDAFLRHQTCARFAGLSRFAREAGFRSILLLPGPVHADLGAQRSLDLAAGALAQLAGIASSEGVRLHAEIDCDSCACTPSAAKELCERVPEMRLTLDYSHFIFRGFSQAEVEPLHRHTGHVHVRQASPGRIVANGREGTIDYARVVRSLAEAGYEGLYSVEYLACRQSEEAGVDCELETRRMAAELDAYLAVRA